MGGEYRYRQIGTLTIIMILLAAAVSALVLFAALQTAEGADVTLLRIAGLLIVVACALVLAAFHAFTIEVSDQELSLWFGWGVFRTSVSLSEIRSVSVVRNPWYYFWGIKSMPGGRFYSISPGGRSVELALGDGRKIRLGTDRPEELRDRLLRALEPLA